MAAHWECIACHRSDKAEDSEGIPGLQRKNTDATDGKTNEQGRKGAFLRKRDRGGLARAALLAGTSVGIR